MAPATQPKGNAELAARVRAALAYKGITDAAACKALGVEKRQIGRYKSAKETDLPAHLIPKLIEATGVPSWFFDTGFNARPEGVEPELAERVEALEHRLEAFERAGLSRLLQQAIDRPADPPSEQRPSGSDDQRQEGQ